MVDWCWRSFGPILVMVHIYGICTSQAANHCDSNPCKNGGTCNSWSAAYPCSCPKGFLGKFCDPSPCMSNPCQNGGTCYAYKPDQYFCLCPSGISGNTCNLAPCKDTPCKNGGMCQPLYDKYICTCPSAYAGSTCEASSPCLSSPCQNGGTCSAYGDSSYSCLCKTGYVGLKCECQSQSTLKLLQCISRFQTSGLTARSGSSFCQAFTNYFCCISSAFSGCPSIIESGLKTAMSFYDDKILGLPLCGEPMKKFLSFKGAGCINDTYTGDFSQLGSCDVGILQYASFKCMTPLMTRSRPGTPPNITCGDMKTMMCCVRRPMEACPVFKAAMDRSLMKLTETTGGLNSQYMNCGFSLTGVLSGYGVCTDIWKNSPTIWPFSSDRGATTPISATYRPGPTTTIIIFTQLLCFLFLLQNIA